VLLSRTIVLATFQEPGSDLVGFGAEEASACAVLDNALSFVHEELAA